MIKPKLSFIGDLTVDIYPKLNSAHLAGSSLTCALWAKKLGAEPTILAAVGNDEAGKRYKEFFKKENLSLKFLKTLSASRRISTSQIEIFLDKNGERFWGKWDPGVLAKYHLEKKDYDFLKDQDAVAMPIYAKTQHLLDELVCHTWKVRQSSRQENTFQVKNPRPLIAVDFDDLSQFDKSIKIIEDHLPYIDIVLCGLDMVSDAKIIRKLQNLASSYSSPKTPNSPNRPKLIIVTLNKNGSLAFLGNKVFRQKAHPPAGGKVVNSTGAGDAYLAGFLVEYVKSKNVQKSLLQGTKTATKAIFKQNTS